MPGADKTMVGHAVWLAKADLSTGMVGEFPELQGVMGRYYALHDGEDKEVADAVAEHYSPLGPGDRCPTAPVSVAVALADKIDTLANFFAIDEKPTGSKIPTRCAAPPSASFALLSRTSCAMKLLPVFRAAASQGDPRAALLDFFADRLKVALRNQGVRHDLIAAVFALGDEDDLVRLLARVEARGAFLKTEDGANLLVAYRRASNIVRIEEGKDKARYADAPDPQLFREEGEGALAKHLLTAISERTAPPLEEEEFAGAMAALARLRHLLMIFSIKSRPIPTIGRFGQTG